MSVSLAAKRGSRDRLKVRRRCGCSLCARQMRCTEPSEMPMAWAIARPVQWVAWCGGSVQVSATSRAVVPQLSASCRACGFVTQQPINSHLGEALLPPPHSWPADADALRHLLRRPPIRRSEHDAHPFDVLARPVTVSRKRRQLLALHGAQDHAYCASHGSFPPRPGPILHIPTTL